MFRLSAVIGGAAKRASEILEEERKEAMDTVNEQLKIWTELGLPKVRQRKELRRTKNKIFNALSDKGFSNPQIAVIMGQGKGQATLDHIQQMRNTYEKYNVKPAEIVALSPDYKDTGLTKDQILENVMGKVDRGMDVSDALMDVSGQKDGTLTSILGGNLTGIQKRRMDAFSLAAGVDMNELRALASDSITYDQPLVTGDVKLVDPAAAARAEKSLKDSEAGLFSSTSFLNSILRRTAPMAGVNAEVNDRGDIIYKPDAQKRDIQASDIVLEELDKYQGETDKNKFGFQDMKIVQDRIRSRLDEAGILIGTQSPQPSGATGTPQGQQGTNIYSGMSASGIKAQAIKDLQGLSPQDQTAGLAQARAAIIAALNKSKTPGTTPQQIQDEADRIVAEIQAAL